MAGVSVERRGTKWRYRFDVSQVDGRRIRVSQGGYGTKKEAMAAGIKRLGEFEHAGSVFTPSEISYGDYLDEWMRRYCKPNLKPETVVNYEKRIKLHIKPKLGMYKVKNLTSAVLQEMINEKFQAGYSRNTLSTLRGILSSSLEYAVEPMKYIDKNPMAYVKLPSYRAKAEVPTRKDPHIYVTPEQMQQILTRFPEGSTSHIPLQLGYRCGLRIGEAFALFWSDVDFENHRLSVNRQIQWDKKAQLWYLTEPKYESFRTIDLDDEMYDLLAREKERQERAKAYRGQQWIQQYESKKRLVNTAGNGEPIDMVMVRDDGSLIAPRIMQHVSSIIHHKMKLPEFDFHSLRHTHCSMMIAAGAPLKYVQTRLGHKRADVTLNVYQHVTEVMEEGGKDVLNSVFKRAS